MQADKTPQLQKETSEQEAPETRGGSYAGAREAPTSQGGFGAGVLSGLMQSLFCVGY